MDPWQLMAESNFAACLLQFIWAVYNRTYVLAKYLIFMIIDGVWQVQCVPAAARHPRG